VELPCEAFGEVGGGAAGLLLHRLHVHLLIFIHVPLLLLLLLLFVVVFVLLVIITVVIELIIGRDFLRG